MLRINILFKNCLEFILVVNPHNVKCLLCVALSFSRTLTFHNVPDSIEGRITQAQVLLNKARQRFNLIVTHSDQTVCFNSLNE